MLGVLSNLAGILSLATLWAVIAYARRQAFAHLEAHLEMLESWTAGQGFAPGSSTPAQRLRWIHPRWALIPTSSVQPISELSLVQNVFLPTELTRHLVHVAQGAATMNRAIERLELMKTSNLDLMLRVQRKLDRGLDKVFGTKDSPPDDSTQEDFEEVVRTAQLSEDETAWARTVGGLVETIHEEIIGVEGGRGLQNHLVALRREFDRIRAG